MEEFIFSITWGLNGDTVPFEDYSVGYNYGLHALYFHFNQGIHIKIM